MQLRLQKKHLMTWSLKPALQRARIIFKFKELIEKNSDELTQVNSFRAWKSL